MKSAFPSVLLGAMGILFLPSVAPAQGIPFQAQAYSGSEGGTPDRESFSGYSDRAGWDRQAAQVPSPRTPSPNNDPLFSASAPWSGRDVARETPRRIPPISPPEAPQDFGPFGGWGDGRPPSGPPEEIENLPETNRQLLLDEKELGEPLQLGPAIPLKPPPWTWQLLPEGLIYRSYLAGVKEPRCGIVFNHDTHYGWIWDIGLGARLGMIRYGTDDPLHPEGIQLDFEGAALLRIDPEEEQDVVGCDYRYGFPLTWGSGPIRTKFAFYHLSSHLGDEFLLKNPGIYRDNYVRNALVFGKSLYLTPSLRFYGEVAWSFHTDGRAKPWEFQCGMDFSPLRVGQWDGAPFLALNGHWREEFDYHGSFTVQTGWQWRNAHGGTFRIGMQYYRGKSEQWSLADRSEDKIGIGIWYDF